MVAVEEVLAIVLDALSKILGLILRIVRMDLSS